MDKAEPDNARLRLYNWPCQQRRPHGLHDQTIRHKAGRRYEVRYRKPDGTPTGKRGFKRKMEADVGGAANVTTAKTTGAYIDPQAGRRRVEDFWEPWIAAKKTESKASTIDLIERVWRVHIEPKWGMREVQSITHDEVQVWISEMSMTKSASLVRRTTFTLRALLKKRRPTSASMKIHATISLCLAW